jgi:hypothetical protein
MSANHTRATQERFNKDAAIAATQSAALKGAALAFGKPPVKPKPQANTYSGNNGALAAATKVGGAQNPNDKASASKFHGPQDGQKQGHLDIFENPDGRQSVNHAEQIVAHQRHGNSVLEGNKLLRPRAEQTKSASFLAANIAASRSPSVSPNVTGQQQRFSTGGGWERTMTSPRSPSPLKSSISSRGSDQPLDLTSIAPTTSLIDMFEQNKARSSNLSQTRPALLAAQRSVNSLIQQKASVPTKLRTPSPPSLNPRRPEIMTRISPNQETSTSGSGSPIKPHNPLGTSKPISIPSKPETTSSPKNDIEETSSDDSFVSASDRRPSFRAEVYQQKRRVHSTSQLSMDSAVTVDSLANAIVASSLASSRAASPSRNLRAPAPPPSRRSPRSHHLLHHGETSRSASPAKPISLRTTMRKPKLDEEPDEGAKRRMKKAHLMKKHPNKHHEGDRKRWRDEITERERKRYEAVWASNKGLHLPSGPSAESSVCNLVVRDIWSRSRLNNDVLEEVYALVDRTGQGSLGKEEFVVGLWLIDQRLKGRKLPIRVSDSVWHSVGVLRGMKMKPRKNKSNVL